LFGIFAKFEREMLVARVSGGLARGKDALKRDGEVVSKAGVVPRPAKKISTEIERKVRFARGPVSSPRPSSSGSETVRYRGFERR
jgi:hypothetical protein